MGLVTLLLTGSALATTFSLNEDALLLLWEIDVDGATGTQLQNVTNDSGYAGTTPMIGVVGYAGNIVGDYGASPTKDDTFAWVKIGANETGTQSGDPTNKVTDVIEAVTGTASDDLDSYDDLALVLSNDNDDIWYVKLYVEDSTSNVESGWAAITPGTSAGLSVDLVGLDGDGANVTGLGFYVGGYMGWTAEQGNPSKTDNFHTSAEPIPEPGTLLLLGSGLIGIAGYGKLRLGRKKK
jgi:hypothetical protein